MFRRKKDSEVDVASLNEILSIGRKLMRIGYFVTIIVLVVMSTYLIKEWKILRIFGEFLGVISPVFIGFLVAWLFDPVVTWLHDKKIPRIIGCIIVYFFILGGLFLFLYLFLPTFGIQIKDFVGTVPDILVDIKIFINNLFDTVNIGVINIDTIKEQMYSSIEKLGSSITTNIPNMVINVGKSLFSGGVAVVLGIMIGFYMLYDYDKLNKHIENVIPTKWLSNYRELTQRINTSLRGYVQGVFLIMFLVFMTQSIGLTIAGLKAPLIFALFCAIMDIIPYFGPYIGAIPAVIVGFTISPVVGVCCVISIVIVQTLENNFYQPLIMGHTMELHPVTIMISLLIFQHFFGIIGMVVATPVVACLKVIFKFINEKTNIFGFLNK